MIMFAGRSNIRLLVAVAMGLAIGGLSAAGLRFSGRPFGAIGANEQRQYGRADVGGPFLLTDQDGKTVTNLDLMGRPSLMIFGRTLGDSLSSAALNVVGEAVQAETARGLEFRIVYVPLDADISRIRELKQFLGQFDREIIGLTGDNSDVLAMARSFRLPVGGNSDVDAQTFKPVIFVLDSNGMYLAHRVMPIRVTDLIKLIAKTY